jgi:release factor glutamine methyltransferase
VSEVWTTLKVLNWTAGRFAERSLGSPRLDAEVLLGHALKLSRVQLYTGHDKPLGPDELTAFRDLVRRRLAGEPVAYLVGEQEFWSLALKVDPRVLIPRRDTETLVEVGLAAARTVAGPLVADVCTGSGAVALALAHELPDARVVGSDLSPGALAVARENVARHGLGARVALVVADLLEPLAGPFDLILSNPPYVPSAEIATLTAEVRREPRAALDGGPDGLALIRRLVPQAAARLRRGGVLALEHACDQGPRVAALLGAAGLVDVTTVRDLAGLDRVTRGTLPRPA